MVSGRGSRTGRASARSLPCFPAIVPDEHIRRQVAGVDAMRGEAVDTAEEPLFVAEIIPGSIGNRAIVLSNEPATEQRTSFADDWKI
jgi:hypothetical protein